MAEGGQFNRVLQLGLASDKCDYFLVCKTLVTNVCHVARIKNC